MNEIRIIGGQWKRTRLRIANAQAVRPTPDRVRETLFNWLGQDLSGCHVLDMFAGTGALAFEAASRGASRVMAFDINPTLVRQMLASRDSLARSGGTDALEIHTADVLHSRHLHLENATSMDVVFIDPPYADHAAYPLAIALALRLLKPGGLAYVEAAAPFSQVQATEYGFTPLRYLRAGAVHAHLWAKPLETIVNQGTSPTS